MLQAAHVASGALCRARQPIETHAAQHKIGSTWLKQGLIQIQNNGVKQTSWEYQSINKPVRLVCAALTDVEGTLLGVFFTPTQPWQLYQGEPADVLAKKAKQQVVHDMTNSELPD